MAKLRKEGRLEILVAHAGVALFDRRLEQIFMHGHPLLDIGYLHFVLQALDIECLACPAAGKRVYEVLLEYDSLASPVH